MSSEQFPSDNPTSPLSEQATDMPESLEQSTDQSDTSGSFIRAGGAQLAENLSRIAEHGPDGIQAYLTDLLADTEGNVPAAEKAAAFTLLAERQKQDIREHVVKAGADMHNSLESSTTTARTGIGRFANISGSAMNEIKYRFTQPGAEDFVRAAAGHVQASLDGLNVHQQAWGQTQRQTLGSYQKTVATTGATEAHINENMTLLEEGKNPADVSRLIDPTITETIAEEIHKAVSDGKPAQVVVADLLTTPQNETTLEQIRLYSEFANNYKTMVERITADFDGTIKNQSAALLDFRQKGRPIANMPLFAEQVNQTPLRLAGAFDSTSGLRKNLQRQLRDLETPIPPAFISSEPTISVPPSETTEPTTTIPKQVIDDTTESIAVQEQPEAPVYTDRPDYSRAKGTKEVIDPAKQAPETRSKPTPTAEPFIAPSPYTQGYTQSDPKRSPRIARQPSKKHRPADPNAFPKPKDTPRWIRTIDEVNRRNEQ